MIIFDTNLVIAICFFIFLYLAYKPVRKSVINSLNAHIKQIENKLAETKQLKDDAKKLLLDIQNEMKEFEQKRQDILANAQNSTEKLINQRIKESELLLKRQKDSALKSIEHQKDKASDQMCHEFSEHLLTLVKKYLVETENNYCSDEEIIKRFLRN